MTTLRNLADVRAYFQANKAPIFYVCTLPHNLLGLRRWVSNLSFIAAGDFLDGALPGSYAPVRLDPGDDGFERINARLLDDPGVRRFIAAGGPGSKALFLMFDEGNEVRARTLGLEVCFPSAALRRSLDDKLATTRLGDEAGVPSVPHVLARVHGYASLRRRAGHLGPDLVIQLPFGDSGTTTFFVSDEAGYARCAAAIEGAGEVKIMRRIRCREAAIEACVTSRGVVVGPLAAELVGFPELTPYRGGWCGNEIGAGLFAPAVIDAARNATRRIGERLATMGYRGIFGLDFLLDEDTGELWLGELNPRITGLTPLTTQVAGDLGCVPLLLLHLLEWSGVDHDLDLEELDERFRLLSGTRGWSHLVIKETAGMGGVVAHAPPSGVFRLDANGRATFVRPALDPGEIAAEDEALVVRTVNRGWARARGTCLARLIAPVRMMTSEHRLAAHAHAWIDAVHGAFGAGAG